MEPMLAPAAGAAARAWDLEAGAVVASVEAAVAVAAEARGPVVAAAVAVAVVGDVAAGAADKRRICPNGKIMPEGTSLGVEHRRSGAQI